MDAKNIQFLVEKAKNDILQEVNDRLPRKVGITAVNHFRQNFRDAGFRDGGVRPWQRTKRQDSKSPDAKYTPLTSRRDHLMRSIEFQTEPGQVLISDPVPYAAIHNDGGDISTPPSYRRKIQTRIANAFEQADGAIIEVPKFVSRRNIARAVKGKLKLVSENKYIIIKHGNSCYVYNKPYLKQKKQG